MVAAYPFTADDLLCQALAMIDLPRLAPCCHQYCVHCLVVEAREVLEQTLPEAEQDCLVWEGLRHFWTAVPADRPMLDAIARCQVEGVTETRDLCEQALRRALGSR